MSCLMNMVCGMSQNYRKYMLLKSRLFPLDRDLKHLLSREFYVNFGPLKSETRARNKVTKRIETESEKTLMRVDVYASTMLS